MEKTILCTACRKSKEQSSFNTEFHGKKKGKCIECVTEWSAAQNAKVDRTVHKIDNDNYKIGDSFHKEEYTPLSQDQFEALEKKLELISKSDLSAIEKYSSKLTTLFHCHDKVYITTKLYSPNSKSRISYFPINSEEMQVYNELVDSIIRTAGNKGDEYSNYKGWSLTFEELRNNLAEQTKNGSPIDCIDSELSKIKRLYAKNNEITRDDVYNYFDKDIPQPNALIANKGIVGPNIYNYLKVGKKIEYDYRFIHWYYHVLIIRCEEILKYERFLEDQQLIIELGGPGQHQAAEEYIGTGIHTNESINNFCKPMPVSFPENHFKLFVEATGKNGKPFLTASQLEAFIAKAFLGKSYLPKQRFNFGPRERSMITSEFHEFYFKASSTYEPTTQCLDKYIKLLTDNFEGWDFDRVKRNFAKKPKNRL